MLAAKGLRDYFRNPRGFFADHLRRYCRTPRKAPIYWLLQSDRRSYGLWLYYHRLDQDTLFKALQGYVNPKLAREEQRLAEQFLLAGGNLKELALALGTSYPTLRKRLDALIERLQGLRNSDEEEAGRLLDGVETGQTRAEEAARIIREMSGGT